MNKNEDKNPYKDISNDDIYIVIEKTYPYETEVNINDKSELESISITKNNLEKIIVLGELKSERNVLLQNSESAEVQFEKEEKIYFTISKLSYSCIEVDQNCTDIMNEIAKDYKEFGGIWEYDIESKSAKRIYTPENENTEINETKKITTTKSSKNYLGFEVILGSEKKSYYYDVDGGKFVELDMP